MQPNYQLARFLFFAGLFLLFSVPVLIAVVKSVETGKIKSSKEATEKINSSIENPKCCDKSKPNKVTIII